MRINIYMYRIIYYNIYDNILKSNKLKIELPIVVMGILVIARNPSFSNEIKERGYS